MKTILFVIGIIASLIVAWYFLWYKPGADAAMANNACKTAGGITGTLQNGACVPPTPIADVLPSKPKIH